MLPIPPFFVWESAQYAKTINTLFQESGKGYESEEVILISSVQSSLYSAVKFNTIELRIRHKDQDPKKQKELDSCLDNFNVYLTHSTDSHYKFNNKFYKFGSNVDVNNSNEELQLLYGFKKNSNDSPFTKNIAYEKLANGELMLSPYSMWRVKLTLVNPKGKNYFNDLEKYSKFVNLELVGTGSYVDEGNMTNDEKGALLVDSYYESDDMFPIIADLR